MDMTPPVPDDGEDIHILLVGPKPWQEQAQQGIANTETVTKESVEQYEQVVGTLTNWSTEVDCIVSAHRFDEGTGLDLLNEFRSRGVSTPFVLAPEDGSESLASDAIKAGVTDYFPVNANTDIGNRCKKAVKSHRDNQQQQEKASQFEAVFANPDRFVAVLNADGTVVRVNQTALQYLGLDERAILGKRFWGLPWNDVGAAHRNLQHTIRRATNGEYGSFEAGLDCSGSETRFEFTVRPVRDDDSTRIVIEGHEVAKRVQLEEELRKSEELHRVTLNNMTDTVLVTDDDGAFTYVCPNVHFIFGYGAEEIHEMGTIDALLGDDLFDRERLESENVLTNIECVATDKEGHDHSLLVNVRSVSIQGGTTLYSCRDITKRKQRERALTQLHQTSRSLLYTETKSETAERIVTDATTVLPAATTAVYRFNSEENALTPAAVSDEFSTIAENLPEIHLDQTTPISRAFVEDETKRREGDDQTDARVRETTSRSEDRAPPFVSLGDYIAVPLGDHGVFLAAGKDADAFDEVSEEIAELLAATAEAAFDRVERETELRERDQRLQHQNQRLSKLNEVNRFIREIDQAMVNAEARAEIERAVCERLTADDRFAFAWISETTVSKQNIRPREWAGDENGYLDSVPLDFTADDTSVEPSVRSADNREPTLVSNVADILRAGPWCREAVSRNFQSVLAIPLVYDDVLFGTLTVYARRPDAFDGMVQSVLCELGDTVASAINAVQRKEALRSNSVIEIEYQVSDPTAILYRLADESGVSIQVEGDVTRNDGTTLVFATVEGESLDNVVEIANGFVGIIEAEPIRENEDDGLVGLLVQDHFVTQVLANHGATLQQLCATPDGISMTVDVPDSVTVRSIDEVISNTYDGAELVAQRKQSRALDTKGKRDRLLDELTERQLEVAQIAYHSGFFDTQRDVTGRDVASMLDISHTAFYDHVRRIERKLFSSLFEKTPPLEVVE